MPDEGSQISRTALHIRHKRCQIRLWLTVFLLICSQTHHNWMSHPNIAILFLGFTDPLGVPG